MRGRVRLLLFFFLLMRLAAPSLAAMPVPSGHGGVPGQTADDGDGPGVALKLQQCEASPVVLDGCIDLLYALAQAEVSRAEMDPAERHVRAAMSMAHQQGGFNRPDVEKFYILLATIIAVQGRTDEAELVLRAAIVGGTTEKWKLERIGRLNCRAGKILAESLAYGRAKPLFLAGLKVTSTALTSAHIDYRLCGLWAMMSFYRQDQLELASEIAKVLTRNESGGAAQLEIYSGALLVWAQVLFRAERYDEAERALRVVFSLERATDASSPSLVDSAITLSLILARRPASIGEARTFSIAGEHVILNELSRGRFDKRAETMLRRNRRVFEARVRVNWAAAHARTELSPSQS